MKDELPDGATARMKSFSQFGEDLLVWKHFAYKRDGFFVEVGANDPENLSQTLLLERHGWQGVLVEPQSTCCERLRSARPRSQVFQVACGSPGQCGMAMLQLSDAGSRLAGARASELPLGGLEQVRVMTLNQILEQTGNPRLDFVSIDVEGFELDVLRGFDLEQHKPSLLLVEDNLPNRLKVHHYLKRHGYRLVKRTGCNNWYVPRCQPFAYSSTWEQIKIYRKMYLGTAFRRLKACLLPKK